jgi:hypothetical protein
MNSNNEYSVYTAEKDGKPAYIITGPIENASYIKTKLEWSLRLFIDVQDPSGYPSDKEAKILNELEDKILGNLKEVTTVFFVARTTWNSERDVYAYVEDPEKANEVLSQLTQDPSNKIEFEYRIEHDPQWEIVDYYLKLPKS